ncbi:MAG: hypothetical protein WB500_08315, partial [Rhodoplanes sp.]
MSRYTDEEKAAIMAEVRANIERADAMLAQRKDPLENVVRFTPKPPPEPEKPARKLAGWTNAEIAAVIERSVGEVREQLDEHCDYINNELASLLTQVFNDVADNFESLRLDLQSLRSLQSKYVETDVAALQADVANLRADLSSLQSIVGNLAFQVGQLADNVSAIERSGGKV